ncbi:MAG: hypothetical protein EXS52_00825 [Candidatus Staskawiczbacteria bacterium]|nr:hypothetical protein [Candidatus Staskawiczbacteria bacterium]
MAEELKKSFISFRRMTGVCLKNANAAVWFLGRYAFLAILLSFLLSILFGGFLILKYASLLYRESGTINSPVTFREDLYAAVLKAQQVREDFLKNLSVKRYSDPFQ